MRRLVAVLGVLAAAAAGLVLAGGAPPARADGSGFSRAVLHSQPNDPILRGAYVKLGSVSLGRSGSTYTATMTEGATSYQLVLTPPVGQTFTEQKYPQVARTATASLPGVDFVGGATACTTMYGQLDIKSITMAGSDVTAMAIEFDLYCDSPTSGQMGGWLAYNMPYGPMGDPATGELVGVTPVRALDTRTGGGPLVPGAARTVAVTGIGEVPAGPALAVVLNVTATAPVGSGHLTLWPSDGTQPDVSNVNFVAGQTVPNLAVVKVGGDGAVKLVAGGSATDAVVDVLGWFAPSEWSQGARFHSVAPTRLLDTRGAGQVALGPGESRVLNVAPAGQASAVALNVTATQASAPTHVTVYPADAAGLPNASNLNVLPGETVPNLVITKVASDGSIRLFNAAGSTHLVVDLAGRFDGDRSTGAGRYVPENPRRLVDTRWGIGKLYAGSQLDLGLTGLSGTLPFEWSAVVANTTVTETDATSHLTAWATGTAKPWASNLNWRAGETRPNVVISGLSVDGFVSVATAVGSTQVIVDLAGWFTA